MILDDLGNVFSKAVDETIENALSSMLAEAEKNMKLPSVTTLAFTPVPAEKAVALQSVKTGLFGGGTKKKFIVSIAEGRTTYAEVLVLARMYKSIERETMETRNPICKYFYKFADLSGTVIREDAPAIDDAFAISLACNGGSSSSNTGCRDTVEPGGYPHMFLVHYYLKDDQFYVLLTREQFEDMTDLVRNAGHYYHFVEDGCGYTW